MCNEQSNRIKQLEESLAHQEAMVQDLNVQLVQQWQTIETLNRRVRELDEKIEEQSVSHTVSQLGEPTPPHY
jgi:uncharacterized coiled-coil protein SlyX